MMAQIVVGLTFEFPWWSNAAMKLAALLWRMAGVDLSGFLSKAIMQHGRIRNTLATTSAMVSR